MMGRVLRHCAVVSGVLYADFHVTGLVPSVAVSGATAALAAQPDAAGRVLALVTRSSSGRMAEQLVASRTVEAIAAQLRVRPDDTTLIAVLDRCADSPLTHAGIVRSGVVVQLCDGERLARASGRDLHAVSALLSKLAGGAFGERTVVELYTLNDALHCCARLCAVTPDVFVQERVALALRGLADVKALQQRLVDDDALGVLLDIASRGDVESGVHVVAALARLTDGPEHRDAALAVARSEAWLSYLRRWAMLRPQRELRHHAAETLAHVLTATNDDDALMVAVLRSVGVDVFESLASSVDTYSLQTVVERCLARLQAQQRNVDVKNEVYTVDSSFNTRRIQIKAG